VYVCVCVGKRFPPGKKVPRAHFLTRLAAAPRPTRVGLERVILGGAAAALRELRASMHTEAGDRLALEVPLCYSPFTLFLFFIFLILGLQRSSSSLKHATEGDTTDHKLPLPQCYMFFLSTQRSDLFQLTCVEGRWLSGSSAARTPLAPRRLHPTAAHACAP